MPLLYYTRGANEQSMLFMVNLSGKTWRRWQLGIVAIALLIIFGINSCSQVSSQARQSHQGQSNNVLEFVPKHALLAGVVDVTATKDNVWRHSNLAQVLSTSVNTWLTPLSLDLDQDIRPLLGKTLAFAITNQDLDRDRSNGRQGGYLLVTDTADGEQLREFLELFWQKQAVAGSQPVLTKISGVPTITGAVAEGQRQLATAIVGERTLMVANDIKVLQQSLQIAQVPTLQLSETNCCAPVWLNLRIPALIDWLGLASPTDMRLRSTPKWQQLHAQIEGHSQQLVINTQLKAIGHKSIATKEPSSQMETSSATRNNPQRYLPSTLAWAAMGQNLLPLWTEITDELEQYEQLPLPLQQWSKWSSTQLAKILSEPLTQLLKNNYAIGQLADGNWLMAVTSSNQQTIDQLDSIAKQQGLTVSQLSFKGQTATAWSRLKTKLDTRNRETTVETDLVALHTKSSDYDVFSTSIGGLAAALEAPNHTLSETKRFKLTVRPTNKDNQEYMYGTWDEIERLLASTRWFSLVKPIVRPWVQSIDAISITSNQQTADQLTGTVSILLKD